MPFDSALVQTVPRPSSSKAKVHNQMADTLLKSGKNQIIHRLDVNFSLPNLYLTLLMVATWTS